MVLMASTACLAILQSLSAAEGRDPLDCVSRNDVVYETLSAEPWEAMPVGGGDLSAMVRCDGDSVHLHLTKSDAWGFQAPADAPLGTRYFNNVSPGHVRLVLDETGKALAQEQFRQRLDLLRGRIVIQLGDEAEGVELAVWGHPSAKVLVVEVSDPNGLLGPVSAELTEWRDSMTVRVGGGQLIGSEVHTRPAAPHMATSGMQDYFDEGADPLLGRGTAVVVGASGVEPSDAVVRDKTASMRFPETRPEQYAMVIACGVTPKGDPIGAAQREYAATKLGLDGLRSEHEAWWRNYWRKSYLALTSPDGMAEWLTASHYVHLYTLACVNRGPVPAKWDGGPGLMRGDERTWGLAEWVQEIRFTYLPLYAANRLEMVRGLTKHYTQMRPYLLEQTRKMWDLPGLWIPETVLPWGGVEDWSLDGSRECSSGFAPWDPANAPYGLFERYNRYVGFLFACGPELCSHYMAYYRYSRDEEFLKREAYPMLRDVAEFMAALLHKGEDGLYHLESANALETWWQVRDPADAMDGMRWLFAEFIALSKDLGRDEALRVQCAERLAGLPAPPPGLWHPDGRIDASVDVYAPAAAMGTPPKHCNFENPGLYRVFPFGLSGIGSSDYERAARTFEHRIFPLCQSWSMDAIWAARLGLKEQACRILGEHTRKWNRFRYGGWDSGNSAVFPDNLAVAPYIDGAGVAFFALHEILLQSHEGAIRILPAMAGDWSGVYGLRAEGGFLVSAKFVAGKARWVKVYSERNGTCRIINPWDGVCVVKDSYGAVSRYEARELVFEARTGRRYHLTPEGAPGEEAGGFAFDAEPYQGPGLRGRDSGQG